MEIRALRADDGMMIRRVRLASLADAPYAFGAGSFAEESALPEAHWHQLAAQVGGLDPKWRNRCAGYVVLDGNDPCGTATCYLCPTVPRRAYVTAAWVDARFRGRGLGRQLVEEAVAWARSRSADHLRLWVDDTNPRAAAFYRAIGFVPTGESQPVAKNSPNRQSAFERPLTPAS